MKTTNQNHTCGIFKTSSHFIAVINKYNCCHHPIKIAHTEKAARRFIAWLKAHQSPTIIMTENCRQKDYLPKLIIINGMQLVTIPFGILNDICIVAGWKHRTPKKMAAILARFPYAKNMNNLLEKNYPKQLMIEW